MTGRKISHYEMVERLGAGGVGEVYKAHDSKLNRTVAIKVLREELSSGPVRLKRFEQEARAASALNHPNIVTIYDIGEDGGTPFIAMEYVKGRTLREILVEGALPIRKLRDLGAQIGGGLAKAHAAGIVHRDLKPENMMVSEDGFVKILDFGLAKLTEEARAEGEYGSELVTKTQHLTRSGVIVGTVGYMSPEQASGQKLSYRSDQFSLGLILYEMATGKMAFRRDTAAQTLAAIVEAEPEPMAKLNPRVPAHLARIVERCLSKKPSERYESTLDLARDLAGLRESPAETERGREREPKPVREGAVRHRWGRLAGVLAIPSVVLVLVLGYLLVNVSLKPPSRLEVASVERVTDFAGEEIYPSLSPDGNWVVYASRAAGNWDIYLQSVGGDKPFNLTENSPDADTMPAFSPDGERIAFRSERGGGGIFVMGRTGESVRRVTPPGPPPSQLGEFGFHPSWSPDGEKIVVATASAFTALNRGGMYSELWVTEFASGNMERIQEADANQPQWSPNGHRIAYFTGAVGTENKDIWTIPATGGTPVRVTIDDAVDWNPVWGPDGTMLYFLSERGGSANLWRVPIDETSGRLLGELAPVTVGESSARDHVSISADGRRIAYSVESISRNIQRYGFDPESEEIVVGPGDVTVGAVNRGAPMLSSDGEWLAFREEGQIVVSRPDGSEPRKLVTGGLHAWSPDSTRIAFISNRGGSRDIWVIGRDGSGLRQLTDEPEETLSSPVWAPDGKRMFGMSLTRHKGFIFDVSRPWHEQTPWELPTLNEQGDHLVARSWSSDGRRLLGVWPPDHSGIVGIAFYDFESGAYETVVMVANGGRPRWLSDGKRFLFTSSEERIRLGAEPGLAPLATRLTSVYLADRETKAYREILNVEPDTLSNDGFWISSDDRTLYITRQSREADIWLLELNMDVSKTREHSRRTHEDTRVSSSR